MKPTFTSLAAAMMAASAVPVVADAADDTVLPTVDVKATAESEYKAETSSPKYTAPLVDTPRSITVVTEEVLRDTGAASLADVLRTTPGITMGAGEGGNPQGDRPFIRGFDAQSDTFIDGVRDVGAQSREVFNLEQIEITKGSNSTFGGRGSAGGSINLVSKTPKAESFLAGSIGIGMDSYKRVTLDANERLSDSIAARLNLLVHDADVAGRDEVTSTRYGIAPSILFGLGKPTRLTASYYHLQTEEMPDPGMPYQYSNANRPAGVLNRPVKGVDRNNFYGLVNRDFRDSTADIGTVTVEHDLTDSLTVRNTTRYGRTMQDYILSQPDDSQGNVVNGQVWRRSNSRTGATKGAINQTDLFGQFQTGGIKHSFSTGIEVSKEDAERGSYNVGTRNSATSCGANVGAPGDYNCTDLYNPNPYDPWVSTNPGGRPIRAVGGTTTKSDTKAIYAFDTITLSEQFLLNLGLRYDDFSVKATTVSTANVTTKASSDSKYWTGQGGIVWKPVESGSVYLSYSSAATPAGAMLGEGSDGNPLSAQDLDPEETKTYELGTKWEVLDQRLSLTAAVFRTEKDNARVLVDLNTYELAGKTRVDGVELGISGSLTENWKAFGGYSYLKSELVDGGRTNIGTALAPNFVTNPNNGNELANTPKESASLWSTYDITRGITIGGGAFYVDRVWGDAANTRYVPSYVRYDAMASYAINKNVNLRLNVQNLTDKVYYDKAYASHFASIAPGRTAFITADFKF